MRTANDEDPVADTALVAKAHAILAPIDRNRQIIRLRTAGVSDHDIAARLAHTPAVVDRVAHREPDILTPPPSPLEVIARHILGQISHDELMDDLLARRYTAGYIPDGTYDGWVRGTWSEIEIASATRLLSSTDFAQLVHLAPDS